MIWTAVGATALAAQLWLVATGRRRISYRWPWNAVVAAAFIAHFAHTHYTEGRI